MAKESFAAKLTSLWIGGFVIWTLKGFRGRLKQQFEEKYENRNIWTGYLFTLIVVIIFIYFCY